MQDDTGLAFFWPATGVAALWLLRGRTARRSRSTAALLVLGTIVIDILMGSPPCRRVLFGLANLVVGVVVRMASSLHRGALLLGPAPRRWPRNATSGPGVASRAAALVSAVPGLSGPARRERRLDLGGAGPVWVVRNACSTFVVAPPSWRLLTALFRAHARRGWAPSAPPSPRRYWRSSCSSRLTVALGAAAVLFGAPTGCRSRSC